MKFFDAAEALGLPNHARWTQFSHDQQDAIARLTDKPPRYLQQAEENIRFIRSHYLQPDFRREWKNRPLKSHGFARWLETERQQMAQASINFHLAPLDRILAKFRLARILEAQGKAISPAKTPLALP